MRDNFYVFAPDYYLWCIEIHAISYLLYNKENLIDDKSIEVICREYAESNKGFEMFDKSFVEAYIKSSTKFLSQYKGQSREKVIISLLDFHETWDNFSLSIMYLKILFNSFNYYTSSVILYFYKVLLVNINPNPNKRHSLNDTINKFFDLYSNENVEIDEIIKMFVGSDIDTIKLKTLSTNDANYINTISKDFNTKRDISTITN